MLRIRPVRLADHEEVLSLANIAGIGMINLPPDGAVLKQRIEDAVDSFRDHPPQPQAYRFLLVLEDMAAKKLVGTCGIAAHVGLTKPFYSYKLSTIVQASTNLGIYSLQQVLHMVNDYTGATELGSLFLHQDSRGGGNGGFLSRSRLMMLAEFPQLFSDVVISEIRGVQDKKGSSPFYDHLARHFFQMDFRQATYIYATQGGQFINDLMPKYPIYVNLLHADAQSVIGQPFEASKPAMKFLTDEGFAYQGYIDLFDAGPTVQAELGRIHTVASSRKIAVGEIKKTVEGPVHMISNSRLADFTVTRGGVIAKGEESVTIAGDVAEALGVEKGDMVRFSAL